jgi:hypothetical protein
MNKMRKTLLTLAFILLAGMSYGQTPEVIQQQVDNYIADTLDGMGPAIFGYVQKPSLWMGDAAMQLNYESDAYIGGGESLSPWEDYPVHLVFGMTLGLAAEDGLGGLGKFVSGDFGGGFPAIPAFAMDLRIGGVYLPIDLGFSFLQHTGDGTSLLAGVFNGISSLSDAEVAVITQAFGIDIRYRLIAEGVGFDFTGHKRKAPFEFKFPLLSNIEEFFRPEFWQQFAHPDFLVSLIPDVSVGFGYAWTTFGIEGNVIANKGDPYEADALVAMRFEGEAWYASIQASKTIGFLRPYLGLRIGAARGKAGVDVTVDNSFRASSLGLPDDGRVYRGHGERSWASETAWQPAAILFYGIGLNFPLLQIGVGFTSNFNNDIDTAEGMNITFRMKI